MRKLSTIPALLIAVLLALVPSAARAQKALVYCPTGDDATCATVVSTLSSTGAYPQGVDRGYDGSGGSVDLRTVDLYAYSVFFVPSLSDDDEATPYALLRDPAVAGALRNALLGRRAFWSGTPDLGDANRDKKNALINNLAAWAGANYANVRGPGLVVLQDNSLDDTKQYNWAQAITGLTITTDAAPQTYASARTLTGAGMAILSSGGSQLAYENMASFGFYFPNGAPGISMDAVGQTGTTVGGQVVLVTAEGANTGGAWVKTDKNDYAPGTTVTMTGAGFQAGESITITLHEDPLVHQDRTLTATADATGAFVNTSFSPEEHDLFVRFVMTAEGQASGRRAQTTFTDGPPNNAATLVVTPASYVVGANSCSPAVTAEFQKSGGGPANVSDQSGADVLLTTAPAGGSFTFYANSNCSTPVSTMVVGGVPTPFVNIAKNNSSTTFYYKAGNTGAYTITATASGVSSLTGTHAATIRLATSFSALAASAPAGGNTTISGRLNSTSLANVTSGLGGKTVTVTLNGVTASPSPVTGTNGANTGNFSTPIALPTTPGTYYAVVSYAGEAGSPGYAASKDSVAVTVSSTVSANTVITRTAGTNPSIYGDAVTFTATVTATSGTSTPTGTIQFRDGATNLGTAVTLSGGAASITTSGLSVASHTISAVYTPGTGFTAGTVTDAAHTVNAKPLTVSGITASNKQYDGGTTATLVTSSAALVGVVGTETVTLNTGSAVGAFSDKSIGTGKTVTVSGLTISGANAGNYTLTQPTTTANITARTLTASFTADSKTYDGSTAAVISGRSVGNKVGTEDVNVTGGTATFADANVATGKTVTATGFTLTGADAANYTLGGVTSWTTTASITQAAQTITFAGLTSKTYGDAPFPLSAAGGSSGNPVTFALGLASKGCSLSGTNNGTVTITGATGTGESCVIVASQAGNTNYSAALDVTQSFTIAKGTPTFTFDLTTLPAKSYGDPAFSVYGGGASYVGSNSSGAVTFALGSGSVGCTVTSGGSVTLSGATSGSDKCIIAASLAADANYNAAGPITQSFGIAKASATLTIDALTLAQTYDGTARVVTATTSPAGLTGVTITYAGGATAPTNAGTYAIVASLSNANYQATNATGNLVVDKADGSVTISNIPGTATYGGNFTPTYTKSGDGTASVTSLTPSVCSVAAGVVSYAAAGSCQLQAAVTAGTNHKAATGGTQSFTVGKATLSVNAANASKTYGNANPAFTWTYSGFQGSDNAGTVTVTGAASCSVSSTTITCAPGTLESANYGFATGSTGTLTVNPRAITVKATDVTRVYGASTPAFAIELADGTTLASGDALSSLGTPTFTPTGTTVSGSPHPIDVSGLSNGNYTISYATGSARGTLTVTAAEATVAFTGAPYTCTFNAVSTCAATAGATGLSGAGLVGPAGTVSISYSGTANGGASYGPSATAPTSAGTYTATATYVPGANDNYKAPTTAPTASITIDKASVTVAFPATTSLTYDGAARSVAPSSVTPSGFTGFSVKYNGVATAPSVVGTYTVSAGLTDANNYTLSGSSTTGQLVINPAEATLSFTGAPYSCTFGASCAGATATAAGVAGGSSPAGTAGVSYAGTANDGTPYGPSSAVPTKAGTYTVTATYAAGSGDNYKAPASAPTTTLTINRASVSLTASGTSFEYTGLGLAPAFGGDVSQVEIKYSGVSPTSYGPSTTKPANVGSYGFAATLTNANDYQFAAGATTSGSFAIVPAAATVSFSGAPYTCTYAPASTCAATASAAGLAAGSTPAGSVSITYTGTANDNTSITNATTAPTKAGTYVATATYVPGTSDNYKAPTTAPTAAITINKANQAALTLTGVPATAPFQSTFTVTPGGGSSSAPLVVSATGVCTVAGNVVTMTSGTGTCTVKVNRAGDGNYNVATEATAAAAAAKIGQPTAVVVSAPSSMTYGQAAATLTATGGNGSGAYSFSVGGSTGCSIASGNQLSVTNATGSCQVTASRAGDDDYNASAASTAQSVTLVKADQAALSVTGPTSGTFGDKLTMAATGGTGSGALSFAVVAGSTACSILTGGPDDGKLSITSGTGTCSITATKAADDNYKSVTSAAQVLAISKAAQATFTITAPASLTYGTTAALSSVGGSGTGTVTYSTGSSTGCSVSGATLSVGNASGTCSVSATKATDDNYLAVTSGAATVTLNKATQAGLSLTVPTSITYGTTGTATTTGGSGTGARTFSAGTSTGCAVNASTGVVTVSNASGSCAISASKAGDDNYNGPATDGPKSVTLDKAISTVTVSCPTAVQTYTGSAITPCTAKASGVGIETGVDVTPVTYTSNIDAGTAGASATWTGDNNHTGSTGTGSFAIGKASSTTTITVSNAVFDGLPHGATAVANGAGGLSQNLTSSITYAGRNGTTYASSTTAPTNVGDYSATVSYAGDLNHLGSSDTKNFSITKAATATTVTVNPGSAQYSDKVVLTATVSPAALNGAAPATGVTFKIGTQVMGTATLAASGGVLSATLTPDAALLESVAGQMAPGSKMVTAEFTGVNANFTVANATTSLTITQENADAAYTGLNYVSTGSSTGSIGNVPLRATVVDPSDGSRGDIRNAKVSFKLRNTTNGTVSDLPGAGTACSNRPVSPLTAGDYTVGTASCTWSADIGSKEADQFTIAIVVDNYYTNNGSTNPADDDVVTVSKDITSFISGGGYIVNDYSSGKYAGDRGLRSNFGFNVKYTRSGANLQGNVTMIVRSGGKTYQIKSTAINSLSSTVPNGSTAGVAQFMAKANIQDVTNPLFPVSVASNATLQLSITDKGEPGTGDTVGLTVLASDNTLLFSSNWNGSKTVEQGLGSGSGGGNVVIR